MKEKSDFDVLFGLADGFAKEAREDHEVVVLHPDEVSVFDDVGYFLGEFSVCFAVGVPGGFIKVDFSGVVME